MKLSEFLTISSLALSTGCSQKVTETTIATKAKIDAIKKENKTHDILRMICKIDGAYVALTICPNGSWRIEKTYDHSEEFGTDTLILADEDGDGVLDDAGYVKKYNNGVDEVAVVTKINHQNYPTSHNNPNSHINILNECNWEIKK